MTSNQDPLRINEIDISGEYISNTPFGDFQSVKLSLRQTRFQHKVAEEGRIADLRGMVVLLSHQEHLEFPLTGYVREYPSHLGRFVLYATFEKDLKPGVSIRGRINGDLDESGLAKLNILYEYERKQVDTLSADVVMARELNAY